MTPQEKAVELLTQFRRHLPINTVTDLEAKGCALICCNEVLGYMGADRGTEFWLEVKAEIEKM